MKYAIAAILLGWSALSSAQLSISDARVREPVPGRYMSAGFLSVTNNSDQPRSLLSASAPWAGLIEIHTHLHENGMMKMRQLESLEIPAGETVTFEPGALHLMLFRLDIPLAESLPLTLCFDHDECVDTEARLWRPE